MLQVWPLKAKINNKNKLSKVDDNALQWYETIEVTHQKNLPASHNFLTFKDSPHPHYVPSFQVRMEAVSWCGFLLVFFNKLKRNLWLVGCDESLEQYAWGFTQ